MASLSEDPWIARYSTVLPEKLHAIGCIALGWSSYEYWAGALFSALLGVTESMARILIDGLGDKSVFDEINAIAEKNGASHKECKH